MIDPSKFKSMPKTVGDIIQCVRKTDKRMDTFFYVQDEKGRKRWMRARDEKVFYLWYVLSKYKIILCSKLEEDDEEESSTGI